ncbi:beta-glucosidase [Verrucomicrobium sp. GAS474]|uniref:GH1 family beta-glucosidase n=1 Tax=Verrucomicrobium sp. GAS474 TaxID=1882831 RepID=UPI00087DEDD1|nr:GH1 family beta-glucosidase [Verrucomicrobium sp. GAS474]SDT92256.1 beta-glucosidase [Verrucomicrobium sp. GAS474]
MKNDLRFPKNFVWGVATAAPQIEGAAFEDGKGESIWDRYSRVPGKVLNGDTLDVACDHYHLYKHDFALMRKLGVKHYRLSIAWPRVYPNGDGAVNPKGLEFYSRLIDAMLKEGITPWVTLFHWDLPQSLEDRGGWRSRVVCDAFGPYAEAVVKALGDRVKNWITLNEVFCFTSLGYDGGDKAPGTKETTKVMNQIYHHAIVCHGLAVRAVRQHGGKGARVGITDNPLCPIPVTETPADIAAARKVYAGASLRLLDPIHRGSYSPAYLKQAGADRPEVRKGDFDLISLPTDFLGLNIYTGPFVRAGKGGKPETLPYPPDFPRTSCPWLYITPQVLYWGTRFAHEVYGAKHIYITENGCGYDDEPLVDGEVHDLHRRDLVRNYLGELHRAIGDGVPVRGYFLWSFMDNYEWQDGYTRRFGIIHVDFKTQKRTPKLSAKWYAQVMKENRLV